MLLLLFKTTKTVQYATVTVKISYLLTEADNWQSMANPNMKESMIAVNFMPGWPRSLYMTKIGPIRKPVMTAVKTKAVKRSSRVRVQAYAKFQVTQLGRLYTGLEAELTIG